MGGYLPGMRLASNMHASKLVLLFHCTADHSYAHRTNGAVLSRVLSFRDKILPHCQANTNYPSQFA